MPQRVIYKILTDAFISKERVLKSISELTGLFNNFLMGKSCLGYQWSTDSLS
ncbi:hypothetical protein yrohd0001_18180 [Yersinia rohdei ATCC 43380]|nr:hypothetical protein yrohd0001_18180 [Yersinia rohdei ATCC 43380]